MRNRNSNMQGFSFIELLISLVLYSFILLGLGKLAAQAMLMNHSAYLYSFASQQIYNIAELICIAPMDVAMQPQFVKGLPNGAMQIRQQGKLKLITLSWYDRFKLHAQPLALQNIQFMLLAN